MSEADQMRWDERYRAASLDWTPAPLVVQFVPPASPGAQALDIACGAGRHSLYLVGLGYAVTAVDISTVALARLAQEAQRRGLGDRVHPRHADLDVWRPAPDAYDLVVQIAFFDRALLPSVVASVRAGGRLVLEVFNQRRLITHPGFTADFAARPGELAALCADWTILHHDEHAGEHGDRTQLVAVKPPVLNL
ncbi:MAG: methyltransferase domain-containing protein [Anaerolineae bacterium]|nr:methyltransferase domain-containing protein [Anaerolineae bacterium]